MTNLQKDRKNVEAEFDLLADQYRQVHAKNIALTGESPEYFSEYKISDLRTFVDERKIDYSSILDFGSGIGNSLPYFRKYFGNSDLICADVSARSIEVAQTRFPGQEEYIKIDDLVPLPDESQDIVFSACVFHHIPHSEHRKWLLELARVTKPGGILAIYEHNPLNPLTVRAVNTCPLDVNAHLIHANVMRKRATNGGWKRSEVAYKVFFPSQLGSLRPLEQRLQWLPLGAQYRMVAHKL